MSPLEIYFTMYVITFGLWCAIPQKTDSSRVFKGIFVSAAWPVYVSTVFFKYLFQAFPQTRVSDDGFVPMLDITPSDQPLLSNLTREDAIIMLEKMTVEA